MRKDASRRPSNVRNSRRVTPGQRLDGAWHGVRAWFARRKDDAEAWDESDEEVPRAPWIRILGVAAALVCVALVGFVVANLSEYTDRTQQFHVAHFQVAGNKRMTREQVIAACGVQPGTSLMKLDPHQVARHLESLPWIRHASVQQMLPSTLAIQVVEYQPFALLLGQQLAIVDRSGYVFKLAEPGEADDLPIITGFSTDLIRAGETVGATEAAQLNLAGALAGRETPTQRKLRDLLNLIEAHAMSPLAQRFPLSEVHFDQVLGTTLISAKDGAEVRLGHAMESDLGRAFTMVGRVLDRVETRGEWLKYALLDDDLRPDRAVVQAVPLGGDVAIEAPKAGGAAGPPTPNAKAAAKKPVSPIEDAPNDD